MPAPKNKKEYDLWIKRLSESHKEYYKNNVVSDETRKKLSVANKGKKPCVGAIKNSVKARKGKPLSANHRKKLCEIRNGRPQPWKLGNKYWNVIKLAPVISRIFYCPHG